MARQGFEKSHQFNGQMGVMLNEALGPSDRGLSVNGFYCSDDWRLFF